MCQLRDKGLLSGSNPSSGEGEEEEGGTVQGEGEGGLGRLFRCVNSEIKTFSVAAIPAQVRRRRRRREGVVRYRERVKGEFGAEKRLLSSVPLVSVLETSHCTCKRQNLLVLFLPAGAQRQIILDRIYSVSEAELTPQRETVGNLLAQLEQREGV